MTDRLSAVSPLQVAIDAVLLADSAVLADTAGGDHVYSQGNIPEDIARGAVSYYVLAESSERPFDAFQGGGNENEEQIVSVSHERGKIGVLKLHGHLVRLLHNKPIAITGHTTITGKVELVITYADPDGVHMRGISRYRVWSRTNG